MPSAFRALARVGTLGVLRSRTIDAEDVGNELVYDAARLRNLRRTERDIANIVDRSGRIAEATFTFNVTIALPYPLLVLAFFSTAFAVARPRRV